MFARRVLLVFVLSLAAATIAIAEDLVVVVHPSRSTSLSIEDVAQIYLRRRLAWEDGSLVVPLNLSYGQELRIRFSRAVLRQSERRLVDYWNRQYFLGVLPPATLASTEAVRRYVASDANAIGYLPESQVDGSVRVVLRVRE